MIIDSGTKSWFGMQFNIVTVAGVVQSKTVMFMCTLLLLYYSPEQEGMLSLLSSMKKHSVRKTGVTVSRVQADSGNGSRD